MKLISSSFLHSQTSQGVMATGVHNKSSYGGF
nr:MAG TPA: hypothetical protein [Crassvirales sp.]